MSIPRHALVLGASGLAGWGVANMLLSKYPQHGVFAKVTALANRSMNVEEACWPSHTDGPELHLISGVDLTQGTHEEFNKRINELIKDFKSVTHVFYFGMSARQIAFIAANDNLS